MPISRYAYLSSNGTSLIHTEMLPYIIIYYKYLLSGGCFFTIYY